MCQKGKIVLKRQNSSTKVHFKMYVDLMFTKSSKNYLEILFKSLPLITNALRYLSNFTLHNDLPYSICFQIHRLLALCHHVYWNIKTYLLQKRHSAIHRKEDWRTLSIWPFTACRPRKSKPTRYPIVYSNGLSFDDFSTHDISSQIYLPVISNCM